MALDLRVEAQSVGPTRLTTAVEKALTPATRDAQDGKAFFSESFVRRHTDFESVGELCRACPAERDTIGGLQAMSADERDAFVAARTDFETWSAMKDAAATSDLVTLLA